MSLFHKPILVVRELGVHFAGENGDLKALEDISFEVYPQEFVCIIGPSGSGKTTLLRVLGGLQVPTSGEVVFEGEPLVGPRRRVGFVFQEANLMPWRTVIENVTLPLEVQEIPTEKMQSRAKDLVELVGLEGFGQMLPRDLSGGMAQRVAIARALVHDPDLLLLDEPFGSLDALTRERMGAELLRIWHVRKKTVVMVTHSINEAVFLADRVFVLSQRPGHIRMDLEVTLPRPRQEEMYYTPEFGALASKMRDAIE